MGFGQLQAVKIWPFFGSGSNRSSPTMMFRKIFDGVSVDASSLVPVQLHGDGGRHFKRTEVMILQWQPVLGGGTKKALPSRVGLAINYRGNTWGTRFLFSVLPRAMYSGTPQRLFRAFGILLTCAPWFVAVAFGILFACAPWFVAIVLIMLISLKL